jgi:hypothetical protein
MGLFSSTTQEPLDPELAKLCIGDDKYTLKGLRREQTAIRELLVSGERILCIAVDNGFGGPAGYARAAVVTDRRLFFVKKTRLEMEIDPRTIRQTRIGQLTPLRVSVSIDGPSANAIQIWLSSVDRAAAFESAIQDQLLAGLVPEERDVPRFYPDWYISVLRAAGKAETDHNIRELSVLVAGNVAANAARWFVGLHDDAARERFYEQLDHASPTQETRADWMIDFLWTWTPRVHLGLRELPDVLRPTALGVLAKHGDPLPNIWNADSKSALG